MSLLAVDLGLRTGLALFEADGRLRWYRSQNFGTATRLRRAVHGLLHELSGLEWVVLEGGGNLAEIWKREAERRGAAVRTISADTWRRDLFYDRERRTGAQAKHNADPLARRIIEWSGAARPTSLRHDAAEAILVGFWAVLQVGWLAEVPLELRR